MTWRGQRTPLGGRITVYLVLGTLLAAGLAAAASGDRVNHLPGSLRTDSLPSLSSSPHGDPWGASAAGASPQLYSAAGSVTDTAFVNYNATASGNFPSVVAGWQVGTPAFVPGAGTLWFPTRPASVSPYPTPEAGPVLVYNTSTDQFTGIVTGLANASALAYDTTNGLVYATLPARNAVAVFDPGTGSPVLAPIPVGSNPMAIVYDASSQDLFVANEGSNNVTVIHAASNSVLYSGIATGAGPIALADDPHDQTLFIADGGDTFVSTIHTTGTYSPGLSVPLTGKASGVAYSNVDGSVAVTVPSSRNLVILNSSTLAVAAISPVGAGATAVATSLNTTYFVAAISSKSNLVVINASSGCNPCTTIPVGQAPGEIAVGPVTGLVYVWNSGSRNVSDVSLVVNRALTTSPSLDAHPMALAHDPRTDRVFVADGSGNEISVLNATTLLTAGSPIFLSSSPTTLAISPLGDTLYAGLTPGVVAINTTTDTIAATNTTLPGSSYPLVVDRTAGVLWVLNSVQGLLGMGLRSLVTSESVTMPIGFAGEAAAALGPGNQNLYVANGANGTVVVVNASTGTIIAPALDPGSGAVSVAYDPADDSVYVLGSNVTVINATTNQVDGVLIPVAPHTLASAITFDGSRDALYAVTSQGGSAPGGNLTVLDGTSLVASQGPTTRIAVGQVPNYALSVPLPGSSAAGSAEIWVADSASGTVSVLSSPLAVPYFAAVPAAIDLGQPVQVFLEYVGGAGPASVSYAGLPSGCTSTDTVRFNCTPTANGTFTIVATLATALGGTATASTTLVIANRLTALETILGTGTPSFDVGSVVSVGASALGGTAPYSFSWSFGDGTTATGPTAQHAFSAPGDFIVSVTATDAHAAAAQNWTLVAIYALPSVQLTLAPSNTTDVGIPITLNATVTGGSGARSANWSVGGGVTLNGLGARYAWSLAGDYTVTFRYVDLSGATVNRSIGITVNTSINATADWSSASQSSAQPPAVGQTILFASSLSGGTPPYRVAWGFGDGSFGYGGRVNHSYGATGTYSIKAEVTDAVGATENLTLSLAVVAPLPSSSPSGINELATGLLLGLLVGGAVAVAVVYLAGRSRKRAPPSPPSPYVPPATSGPNPWNED